MPWPARLDAVCFDAAEPRHLAAFWAVALGWDVGAERADRVDLLPADDTPFRIRFRPVAGSKEDKNRVHLDLTTASSDDQRETVERLTALGACPVDVGQGPTDLHVVLADPEGNEFCVIEPHNSFLADCGRLGSITCDGSREVGIFWRAVLDWPLVWDQDGETAIRAPVGTGPFVTWGPPVPDRSTTDRVHLELALETGDDLHALIERIMSLGGSRVDDASDVPIRLCDPDGHEFSVSN